MLNNVICILPTISLGWIWLLIALGFVVAELATPGLFFFLSFSAGSTVAALCAFLDLSVQTQCVFGFLACLAALVIMRKLFESKTHQESPKTNIEALIGHCGVVTKDITLSQSGRVKFRGEEWPARTRHAEVLAVGQPARIIGIEGNHVIVMPELVHGFAKKPVKD